MSDQMFCQMDATTIAAKVRNREISPVEVAQAVLERMDRLEPQVHAFCACEPHQILQDAKDLEAKIASGYEAGPLAGVPIAIKDLIATKDLPTVSGSVAYKDFVCDEDDVVVERVRAADAIILGKTNVPEFGYSGVGHNMVFEATRNPWNTEKTSGGSSAGSGAAVAAGMGPIALGSDGGGSVRIPSSFCGLVGVKASMGRVPLYPGTKDERYPGISSWESLEHIGPMSRTVQDSALLLEVIAGPDPRDRMSIPTADIDWLAAVRGEFTGKRVAYSRDWGYAAVDPTVAAVVDQAVKAFETDMGCTVEEVTAPWDNPFDAFWATVASESDLRGLRRVMSDIGEDRMTPHIVDFLKRSWTAEDFTDALMHRKQVTNGMWRMMQGFDLLITPTLAVPPFELGIQGPTEINGRQVADTEWLHFTFPLNFTGQPAATVPAGWTSDGLPVGMQLIGPHLGDANVLSAAHSYESARPWADLWPELTQA